MEGPNHPPPVGRARRLFNTIIDRSLLLVAGAAAGLAWANVSAASYDRARHLLHFAVNDVGMVFFFGLAMKEVVDAMRPGGALSSGRAATVPLMAAVGGMAAPALLYLGLVLGTGHVDLLPGWAIPCATDIAFSYMVARAIFGPSHAAIPFLLFLAIVDDALGLVVLAVAYPTGLLSLSSFLLWFGPALGACWILRRARVAGVWPYLLAGGVPAWFAFFRGGLHPALALVAVVPFMAGVRAPGTRDDAPDALEAFEHGWKAPVQVVLFFFGLTNAGVPLAGIGPGTWIVIAALVVGKPAGIALATALATAVGLPRPAGVSGRDVLVVGLSAGIGFTVSLFFAAAAFADGPSLDETKMGALLSFVAAPLAFVAARLLRVSSGPSPHGLSRRGVPSPGPRQ